MSAGPRALALVLALLAGVTSVAGAQGLRAVVTRDGIDVIAVGDSGVVFRSLDGGDHWSQQVLGAGSLRDVAVRNLTIVAVGDSGRIWRSVDDGGSWTLAVAAGAPDLRAVALASDSVGFVVGAAGTILRTPDAGASWSPQLSGVPGTLEAVAMTDVLHGWIAGDAGKLLSTANGGASWNPMSLGTSNDLLSVAQRGNAVWVVGAGGTALRSVNGGASFAPVNLKLDARADVRAVVLQSPDTLWLAGGGGFIRRSVDGGATWTFAQHPMLAPIGDLAVLGNGVWATSPRNRVVVSSVDGGGSWRLPTGAALSYSWGSVPRYANSATVRGNTFALHPVAAGTIYCALGNRILRSGDEGETWLVADTLPSGTTRCNAFLISPRDSNLMLAAVGGTSIADRIVRSTDGGTTWTSPLTHDFGEYGIPLEMDPDRPDTVFFGGENNLTGSPPAELYRSTDFGATWSPIVTATFRSPCDLVVVPDSDNVVLVADGVTGLDHAEYWKSVDGGQTFSLIATMLGDEIPGMACSRLRHNVILGTNWNIGGVQRSTDFGGAWPSVSATDAAWGIDIARDDPGVAVFGLLPGSASYLSTDGGTSWTSVPVPASWGNNHALYLRDRAVVLAQQSSGIWKLSASATVTPVTPSQSVAVTAPNGGEVWSPGQTRGITWTSSGITLARIEYRRAPGEAWQRIADVPGYVGAYSWTIPWDGTTQAKVRVRDAWDSAPDDSSDATFTIAAPRLLASPAALGFGSQAQGSSTPLAIALRNGGATTLHVTSISTGTAIYHAGRSALTLAPGQQDTVGVWFEPTNGTPFPDTLAIVCDDLGHSPTRVPLSGSAPGPSVQVVIPAGGEIWQYGTAHWIAWWSSGVTTVGLDYQVHPDSAWVPIAAGLPASPPNYLWNIPYAPSATARLRVRGASGLPVATSGGTFRLTAPLLRAVPDTLRVPVVVVGGTGGDTLRLENHGTAPLSISSVTIGGGEFWPGRTAFKIAPGASDTLGIFYRPLAPGRDTAAVTIVANDPFSPHHGVVTGVGSTSVSATVLASTAFALEQNRPNPFTSATEIRYALSREEDVTLEVFNLQGRRVATLVRARQSPGEYAVGFGPGRRGGDGPGLETLPAGVYFYRLKAGTFTATRKMLALR